MNHRKLYLTAENLLLYDDFGCIFGESYDEIGEFLINIGEF